MTVVVDSGEMAEPPRGPPWTDYGHTMRRISTLAAVLVALALSACGNGDDGKDDDGDDPKKASSSSAAPTPTDEGPAVDAEDQAIVDAAVVTIKDMPSGWTADAADDDDDDKAARAEIAACVGVAYDELYDDTNAEAKSDDFTSPDDDEVSIKVGLAPTEEWMVHAFGIASGAKYRECALEAIEKDMESQDGLEIGDVSLSQLSVDQLGDEALGYRVTVPVSADGDTIDVIADVVVTRVGRGQVQVSTVSYGAPMSTDELAGFARISLDRLQAGLATP